MATGADREDFASDDLPDYAGLLDPAGLTPQGLATPLPREVATARDIMAQAPRSSPHEIMAWLAALRETNQDGERYNEGWRDRWNPLIVGFFAGTGLTPSGDQTPWCAACINWCIVRAGFKGTGSASSGSFRSPRGPGRPTLGDVAVFRDDTRGPGRGHVGFYVGGDSREITVLGANQLNDRGHHGICRKEYAVRSGRLVLDSFHAVGDAGRGNARPPRSEPPPRSDPPPRRAEPPPGRRTPPAPVPDDRGGNGDGGINRW
jgi:uncharacterized protein (TIGR02594 family)